MGEIFANKAIDKGFISKLYKELMQLKKKKRRRRKKSNQKVVRRPKYTFLQGRHTDG